MENLFGIIFVSIILIGFGYTVYRALNKKSAPNNNYTLPPADVDDNVPTDNGLYSKFEVSINTDSSFNVCFTNSPKIVVYASKSLFCENDQFNSPGAEFSNYNSGSTLFVGYEGKYITVVTNGTNHAVTQSPCSECE